MGAGPSRRVTVDRTGHIFVSGCPLACVSYATTSLPQPVRPRAAITEPSSIHTCITGCPAQGAVLTPHVVPHAAVSHGTVVPRYGTSFDSPALTDGHPGRTPTPHTQSAQ